MSGQQKGALWSRLYSSSSAIGYGFAVLVVAVAVVLSLMLQVWFGSLTFFFFWPAVVISAWFGGLGPGMVATILSVLAVNRVLSQTSADFAGVNLLQLSVFAAITLFMSVVREQQRRVEAQVYVQREQYRITLASIGDGVIATDAVGCVTFMNAEAVDLTGWPFGEAIGHGIHEVFKIVNETTRQPVTIPLIEALDSGRIIGLANHTLLLARDGREYSINDTAAPIRDEKGRITGAVLVFRNVSRERQAEKRLELLQTLTAALAIAPTPDDVIDVIMEKGIRLVGTTHGFVSMLTADQTGVEIINISGYVKEATEPYRRMPLDDSFPYIDSIVKATSIWIESLEMYEQRYPKAAQVSSQVGTKTRATASLPMLVEGKAIGSITITFHHDHTFDADEREFITSLVDVSTQSLERARLNQKASELAALQERQRLARELHDAVSQSLFSANIHAESLPRLWENIPDRALDQIKQLHILTQGASAEMRTLLLELRPENVVNTPLTGLLTQLTQSIQGRRRIGVDLQVDENDGQRLPPEVHFALYRIAQEALNNVVKHGSATQVRVRLLRPDSGAELTIVDNGKGFDLPDTKPGIGLTSMRERAAGIDATLSVRSKPGWGTRVLVNWAVSAE